MSSKEKVSPLCFEDYKEELLKKSLRFSQLLQMAKYLEGRVLTICDATIEEKKAKATKDLMRDAFRTFRYQVEMVIQDGGDEFSVTIPAVDMEVEDGMMKFKQPTT